MTIAEQFKQEGRQEGIQIGQQKGRQEGRQEGKQETIQQMEVVIKLLKEGREVFYISQLTDLPEETILLLKESIKKN